MSRWARVARKYTFTDGAAFLLPVLDPRREAARRVIVRSFAFSSTAGVLVALSFLLALALVRTVLSATFGLADAFVSVVLVYVGYLGAVVFGAWRARGDFWFLGGPEGESVMITGQPTAGGRVKVTMFASSPRKSGQGKALAVQVRAHHRARGLKLHGMAWPWIAKIYLRHGMKCDGWVGPMVKITD